MRSISESFECGNDRRDHHRVGIPASDNCRSGFEPFCGVEARGSIVRASCGIERRH